MATVSEIRSAIMTRLDTINGMRAYDVMPPSPEYPAAAVSMKSFEYSRDFDDGVLYSFYVWVYVAAADLIRAQRALDAYLSPTGATSIKEVLESDPNLGGTCDWVRVTGSSEGPRLVDTAGGKPLAIPLEVEVMSS